VIAVDAGFFLALANPRDRWHPSAVQAAPSVEEGWVTTWPVLTEATYLLRTRLSDEAAIDLMADVVGGGIEVWSPPREAALQIPKLMRRYANLPMDLADASLVLLAEHLGHGRILSTDMRDFGAYRWKNRKPFKNLLVPPR
jgi:uncharacterized protein